MVTGPDSMREMRHGEEDDVEALLRVAFPGPEEAALVRKLRKTRAMAGESVLSCQGKIIGYFALSRLVAPKGWLALAPVAIHPNWQGKRHGARMIGLLSEWARISQTPVVVLGKVSFYERAGFSKAKAANLMTSYPVDHTMLVGVDGVPEKELIYPPAFEGV